MTSTLTSASATQLNEDDPARITNQRVGRILGRMRLTKVPRPGGRGSRRWRVTPDDLQRWIDVYGLPLSLPLATPDTYDPL